MEGCKAGRPGGRKATVPPLLPPAFRGSKSSQSLVDLSPVHDVPPGGDVIGPAVLVFQVVRVLPDVDAEDGLLALHQRAVLIRGAFDHELAALIDHPGPATAEAADAGFRQLFLE